MTPSHSVETKNRQGAAKVARSAPVGPDYKRILIDTLLTALLALAIIGPIVGMNASAPQGGLVLEYRWGMVAALVAIIAAGRLALHLLVWNRPAWVTPQHVKRWGWGAIVVGCVALLLGLFNMDAPLGLLTQIHPSLPAWLLAFGVFALLSGIWLLVSGANETARTKGIQSKLVQTIEPFGKYVGMALLGVALVLPFTPGVDRRIVDLAILMLTYVMLGWGLNIVVGLAGLLDLGYV
ncbi:MAG TPA: DUF3382 domain-containing protein, partial [Nordella sp.]|nr:DUF3382 domain-containing protein [Nordella sp.]